MTDAFEDDLDGSSTSQSYEVIRSTLRASDLLNSDLSDWMTNLPNDKQICPLTRLTIPGSHNSCAFWLDSSLEIAPEQSSIIGKLTNMFGNTAKSIVMDWSLTQVWDIEKQLIGGVRYFDLRVAYRKEDDQFRFVHGLYGQNIEDMLHIVKSFLKKNGKEVVLLDFNHLYTMKIEEHLRLSTLIMSCFADMIHSPRKDNSVASLQDLWLVGEQVIIFYSNSAISEMFPSFFSSKAICSPWPNTDNKTVIFEHISKQGLASKPQNQFHVTQAMMTPQVPTIVKNLKSSLKDVLARDMNDKLVDWLKDNTKECFSFNIILADYIDYEDLVSSILIFNYIY